MGFLSSNLVFSLTILFSKVSKAPISHVGCRDGVHFLGLWAPMDASKGPGHGASALCDR